MNYEWYASNTLRNLITLSTPITPIIQDGLPPTYSRISDTRLRS